MTFALTVARFVRKGRNKLFGVERAVLAELGQLRERLPDVAGALVASVDGLLIAHDLSGAEPETFAAMSAAQLGLGQQIAGAAARGDFQETVTRAAHGYIATFAAGTGALLTVVTGPDLNVGRLHHEARPVAARVGELVGPPGRS
jgi:uncharacterized protein